MPTSTAGVVACLECAVLRDRDVVDVVDPDQHRCFVLAGLNEVVMLVIPPSGIREIELVDAVVRQDWPGLRDAGELASVLEVDRHEAVAERFQDLRGEQSLRLRSNADTSQTFAHPLRLSERRKAV